MFGLGKKRSRLGKWLDKNDLTQEWLVRKAGVGRSTIQELTADNNYREPTTRTIKKIMKAIREIDPSAKADDFFDM
ncbi:helix-turn-helix transcriptional regulator [Priestia filamentosa]|uniref:helix-turn-helix domain-containing protein n=1 Tax=Priestia filamentosa TaxID=1402861 RepID=UPI00397B3D73